jgi:hypothetical protein
MMWSMTAVFLFGTSTSKPKPVVFSVDDRNVPISDSNIVVDEYSDASATGKFCGGRPQYWGQGQKYSVQRQECCGV